MEFRDLKKQYQVLRKEMDRAVLDAMSSGAYIMGPQVRDLERQLAEYVGVKHCLTCANGTDALTLALKAWGIGPGDAVFVPDFTFFSSAEVVPLEGDQAIRAVADKYGLLILEDGAQGFGGSVVMAGCDRPSRACSFGDIATTSFFPAKPVGCYGDGGAVFTDNDEWAALIDSYRVHGKGQFKYDNVRIGMNSRLDTVQAAVLQVKLKTFAEYELDDINIAAEKYTERLKDIVVTPVIPVGFRSSWAQYTIKLQDRALRDDLQAALKTHGIPSMVYYPKPMHLQTAFADSHGGQRSPQNDNMCSVATSLCSQVLSLPMHPYLTDEQIDTVCTAIRNFLK